MEQVDKDINVRSKDEPSDSEKPNNCEHITEDGVTCAKYPACDDCLDNPLNKVKGSERLVKGSEQTDCLDRYDRKTEPTISKMEQVEDEPMKTTDYCDICKRDMCEICIADATNPYCVPSHYEINYEPKDEPQNGYQTFNGTSVYVSRLEDDGQTEKGGCTNCDGKDLCNNAFTEISQYCGAYEPQTERNE